MRAIRKVQESRKLSSACSLQKPPPLGEPRMCNSGGGTFLLWRFGEGITSLFEGNANPRLPQNFCWKQIAAFSSPALRATSNIFAAANRQHFYSNLVSVGVNGTFGSSLAESCPHTSLPTTLQEGILLQNNASCLCVSSVLFLSQTHVFMSPTREPKLLSPGPHHSDTEQWNQKSKMQLFDSLAHPWNFSDNNLCLCFIYDQPYETVSWSISLKFEFSCCFFDCKLRPVIFLPWYF